MGIFYDPQPVISAGELFLLAVVMYDLLGPRYPPVLPLNEFAKVRAD